MKYIVAKLDDKEVIFVFPRSVDHDRMWEMMLGIRFGNDRDWERKFHANPPVSAGFLDQDGCHGRSETLDLSSRPEIDTRLFKESLVNGQSTWTPAMLVPQ